jgi:hypothetical protein
MNTAAYHRRERDPGPTEEEKILDGLSQDVATLIRCATGPKRGLPALARGNMVAIGAGACRQALISLLVNDHHMTSDEARQAADAALVVQTTKGA